MQELKDNLQDFIHGDKTTFIFVITRLIVFILFFISLYLPFIFEVTIIGGKTSVAAFPGGFLFALILFLAIPSYIYFFLMDNKKYIKIVLLVQAITASLIYMYGILVLRVGFPDTATTGFGKHLGFIMLILIWFLFFGEKFISSLIKKYIIKEEVTE